MQKKLWNKDFTLLFQGSAVSIIGDLMYSVAIGYWVYEQTGSNALMGIMSSISMFVTMFLSPFCGSIVDKCNRKWVIVGIDAVQGLVKMGIIQKPLVGRFFKIYTVQQSPGKPAHAAGGGTECLFGAFTGRKCCRSAAFQAFQQKQAVPAAACLAAGQVGQGKGGTGNASIGHTTEFTRTVKCGNTRQRRAVEGSSGIHQAAAVETACGLLYVVLGQAKIINQQHQVIISHIR